MSRKNSTLSLKAIDGELLPEELTYQAQLRASVADHVGRDDIKEIVQGIIKRAKGGDPKAVQQFFDLILGNSTAPTKLTVHNHFSDPEQAARASLALRKQAS